MFLNKKNLAAIGQTKASMPSEKSFTFPERIIQFGTGVLLRGLPDHIIHQANQDGSYDGRIVVVQSTGTAAVAEFAKQDNLYTLCVKGLQDGQEVEQYELINVISRVCAASTQWQDILALAASPDLEVLISNTTEVGITAGTDLITDQPPQTFPTKVCAFLYQRYQAFQGAADKGLVILPTELISNNGQELKKYVLEAANRSGLETGFIDWIEQANDFCDTLVDRIVPGKLPAAEQASTSALLGYEDNLMIMAEPYYLWAISCNQDRVKEKLRFAANQAQVHVVPSIEKFKEIKLRLLNGTHTFSCAPAILAGFSTVKEALQNTEFKAFVSGLMEEIIRCMQGPAFADSELQDFAKQVLDRFGNPNLEHRWASISLNFTSKMRMRNVPLLEASVQREGKVLPCMLLGFAAYVLFMHSKEEGGQFIQEGYGERIVLQDESAAAVLGYLQQADQGILSLLQDSSLWGVDLSTFPGFAAQVQEAIAEIEKHGFLQAFASRA